MLKLDNMKRQFELFQEMQQKGMSLNSFSFVPVLNACASLGALQEGRQTHQQIIQSGCEADVFLGYSFVHM
jgi:sulfur transfer protein SufE